MTHSAIPNNKSPLAEKTNTIDGEIFQQRKAYLTMQRTPVHIVHFIEKLGIMSKQLLSNLTLSARDIFNQFGFMILDH